MYWIPLALVLTTATIFAMVYQHLRIEHPDERYTSYGHD